MYDAIIVGARCAGSPTAMRLARAGHQVLLVDRAEFPSDTLSTHALTGDAVARLRNWGLLDRLCAANGRGVQGPSQIHVGDQSFLVPGEVICPRRTVLDALLVEAAREAGAEVREGSPVTGLLRDAGGAITGIRLRSDGKEGTETARVVIGADGRNSLVAREVGASIYKEKDALACGYYSYFSGFAVDENQIFFGDGVGCFAFPTSHEQTCLAVMRPTEAFESWRTDIEGGFRAAFDAVGQGERYDAAERLEEFRGAAKLPNYYRVPFGPGWALVGDAGYLKDPVLGQGVNDAFRDADNLADGLDQVFRGEEAFETAMARYQEQRDAMSAPVYELNHVFSQLHATPQLVEMLVGAAAARVAAAGT